ncbi:MAG: hypothetical protein LAT75_14495, partial [Candidatus Cyclonatronum sp.]|uniref:hypothetical protein n=1 Tax=Cyclonatronum sp. TaxID=3024185 RepID=UPI0025BB769E
HIACPITIFPELDGDKWNSWKVNMLFFIDDIGFDAKNEDKKNEANMNENQEQIVDMNNADFEFVMNSKFLHRDLIMPQNKHHEANDLLGTYRILFEPFILQASKKNKISLRCRTSDPAFKKILELTKETAGLPDEEIFKLASGDEGGETASIWRYRMGPANDRKLKEIAHKFIAEEHKWFTDFIQPLKQILEKYPAK